MKRVVAILLGAILVCAAPAGALELIRKNLAWTLESDNDPIAQFTNEGEVGRILTLRILIGESSYRYRADFGVPTGESRFLRIREILEQLGQRYPEVKKNASGLLQTEYEGLDREVKVRIVNLNPRTGIIGETSAEAPATPIIRSIQPASGNPAGGTVVTIVGDNFTESTGVKFGGIPAMRSLQSREVLVAVAPQHAAGTVDVEVSSGRRSTRLEKAFEYQAEGPVVLKIDPEEGPGRGGVRISIQGRNFQPGVAARWDGRITEVRYMSPELLALVTPPGQGGAVSLEIVNPDGRSYLFPDAFRYKGVPQLTSINPQTGSRAGGYTITVNGRDFEPGAGVLFGGRYGQTSFINTNTLAATVPQGESGQVDITVTNPDGETATLPQAFLYNEPPRIRSITADPTLIMRLTTCRLKVEAYDPEIERLEYEYRVASGDGTVIGQGNEAVFNSANTNGRVIVEVTVYDTYRAKATGTVEITVQ